MEKVLRWQATLQALGFDPGPLDGKMGPRTAAAIRAFNVAAGMDANAPEADFERALFQAVNAKGITVKVPKLPGVTSPSIPGPGPAPSAIPWWKVGVGGAILAGLAWLAWPQKKRGR